MFTSQHISQTYFLVANPLNPSVTPCVQLYSLQISLLYHSFCSLATKRYTCTFLVSYYPKERPVLGYFMVFKLKRRPINISCCRLASRNMSQPLRFALRNLNTSAAPYLTRFNIKIDNTYNLCSILRCKYFTGTSLLTFYPLSTFFIILLVPFSAFFIAYQFFPPLPASSVKCSLV